MEHSIVSPLDANFKGANNKFMAVNKSALHGENVSK